MFIYSQRNERNSCLDVLFKCSPLPPTSDPISVDRCISCKDLLSMGVEFDSWLDAVEPYAHHRHPPSIFLHVRK